MSGIFQCILCIKFNLSGEALAWHLKSLFLNDQAPLDRMLVYHSQYCFVQHVFDIIFQKID